ncbi:hypothetical protein C5167_038243, partial [Papaver somniferum]
FRRKYSAVVKVVSSSNFRASGVVSHHRFGIIEKEAICEGEKTIKILNPAGLQCTRAMAT